MISDRWSERTTIPGAGKAVDLRCVTKLGLPQLVLGRVKNNEPIDLDRRAMMTTGIKPEEAAKYSDVRLTVTT
jgi:hypothetical protein